MNIRNIQPITVWSPEGQREVDKLKLLTFYGYDFNNNDGGYVDYRLLGPDGTIEFGATLLIPASIVQQWGESDEIIFNYVALTLGLVILNPQARI